PVAARAVRDDSRIVRIVNDVVADDVAGTAFLEFDAVALLDRRAVGVMNVVALDQAVGDATAVVVAAEVHPFAAAVRVVDVVVENFESSVRAAGVRGDRNVAGPVDFTVLYRDVARRHEADAGRTAAEL